MPLQFFPLFVSHVVSVISEAANGARVLAPQRISNFARIQHSFDEYAVIVPAEEIVPEANRGMNACGAGAMAATVAAAKALGCARGLTIEYTTSYDVAPRGQFQMAVGYVGMIFCSS